MSDRLQPLPPTAVEAIIETLQRCQRQTFIAGSTELHREVVGALNTLYDYRVYLYDGEPFEECPPCIDSGLAHHIGLPPHSTADRSVS